MNEPGSGNLKGRAPGNIGSMKAIGISSDLRY